MGDGWRNGREDGRRGEVEVDVDVRGTRRPGELTIPAP